MNCKKSLLVSFLQSELISWSIIIATCVTLTFLQCDYIFIAIIFMIMFAKMQKWYCKIFVFNSLCIVNFHVVSRCGKFTNPNRSCLTVVLQLQDLSFAKLPRLVPDQCLNLEPMRDTVTILEVNLKRPFHVNIPKLESFETYCILMHS